MNGKPRDWQYTSNVKCDSVRLHVISSRFWPLGAPGCQALAYCCAQRRALLSSRTGAAGAEGLLVMVR